MLQYGIELREEPRSVLLLGAHCDDIEIGCGGTAMRLAERYPRTRFVWISLSGDDEREAETRVASKLLLGEVQTEVHVGRFQTSYFPHCGAELKNYVEGLKRFEFRCASHDNSLARTAAAKGSLINRGASSAIRVGGCLCWILIITGCKGLG